MAESGVSCESLVWVELEQRLHLRIVIIVNAIVTIVTIVTCELSSLLPLLTPNNNIH